MIRKMHLSIDFLNRLYREGELTPAKLIDEILASEEFNQKGTWIYKLSKDELYAYLEKLDGIEPASLPLYGIPFAIKDNIDLGGVPTTAACSAFSYIPGESATVVQLLVDAGAIPLGKTNMDQFATGLVGTRSPEEFGFCRNSLNSQYISGGSSSGSAIAVAQNIVSFALGTDTAGSGRVPAALNNIVGLKPTKGLLSTHGVVPACKSLDCVSIFAGNVADAEKVFDIVCSHDEKDPYSRKNLFNNGVRYRGRLKPELTIGIPKKEQLEFFNDKEASILFDESITQIESLGAVIKEIDFTPFAEAAKLLYQGPWVAERYWAVRNTIEQSSESILPETLKIISQGNSYSAVSTFAAMYKLQALKNKADDILAMCDAIMTPTVGTCYTVEQVLEKPIELNSNLGYYTNFMNLLDLSAIAVPTGFFDDGVGFGVTFFAQSFSDKRLLGIASAVTSQIKLPVGSTQFIPENNENSNGNPAYNTIDLAVCGAHLQEMPLNWQLLERGAKKLCSTYTSSRYKLYALSGGPPFRPGLIRCDAGGAEIEVEIWRIAVENFGSFVSEIPAPLGIGKIELCDGSWVVSFICESYAIADAEEITQYRGWREYIKSRNNAKF